MRTFTITTCLVTLLVCGFTMYIVSDLSRQIDRLGSANHDYDTRLKAAAKAFDAVDESADLRELLIKCNAFSAEKAKPGVLESTSFQMMASACDAAVGVNKAALAILVSSNAVVESLEIRASRLELYLIATIACAAIIPGAVVGCILMVLFKRLSPPTAKVALIGQNNSETS